MLHVLVGEATDDRWISTAAKKGKSLPWRVPKEAQLGDRALLELPKLGFVSRCEILTEPRPYTHGSYSARIGNLTLFPAFIPLAFIKESIPQWKWPKYPRGYTTVDGPIEARLVRLTEGYQGVSFSEGAPGSITITKYERNPIARRACIKHYGDSCYVCGFSFGKTYGETAEGYIHVHHLREIASAKRQHKVDPVRDMRPVCPNCHAVIHQRKPPLSITEVKHLLRRARD